jgi:tRNA threonylcarbamoyl adenosine modification protein (Sua5/YciO/YrdC/YwlC family)
VNDDQLSVAADTVRSGGAVALPTDTVYGVGAGLTEPAGIARLFALKGRDPSVAIAVLVADVEAARSLIAGDADERAAFDALVGTYWPGPLTIVMPRRPSLRTELGGDERTIGVRCPANPIARALLARTGPMAVTSANRSGEPPARSPDEVVAVFGGDLVVLDGGRCDDPPSTVVSLVGGHPVVLRAGVVTREEIEGLLGS